MSSIASFREAAAANPGATLKYEGADAGGRVANRQNAAPKSFFGMAVSFVRENTPLGPANSGTMIRFKAALAEEHGSGPAKMLERAVSTAKKELAALNQEYGDAGYPAYDVSRHS